eukprot:Tamp_22283.p3 GENE.Tamp_22283~~Tamp_22283.p3  ORF type:complete len:108 (-),score=1.50 Tamp_22283:216-539(-)
MQLRIISPNNECEYNLTSHDTTPKRLGHPPAPSTQLTLAPIQPAFSSKTAPRRTRVRVGCAVDTRAVHGGTHTLSCPAPLASFSHFSVLILLESTARRLRAACALKS